MSNDARFEVFKARISARSKSLELLYDYTKFHIGVYLTLTASYITVASIKVNDGGRKVEFLATNPYFMGLAVYCFLIGGFAGGVIVSSVTQFTGGGAKHFLASRIGPWNGKFICDYGRNWTYVEHTSFWVGLFSAVGSVLVPQI